MNKNQKNKSNMYEAVLKVLQSHSSSWQAIKALVEAVKEFEGLVAAIRHVGTQGEKDTTGVTRSKNEKKDLMVMKTSDLAAAAFAYANKHKLPELINTFNYSPSFLESADDNSAINISLAIAEEAEKISKALEDYGVSAEEIAEVKTLALVFRDSIGEKSNIKSSSVTITKNLATLFRESDSLLKTQLDKMVNRLHQKEPDFVNTYNNARIIRDLGERGKKEEGKQ